MPFDTAEYVEELTTFGIPVEHAKVQIKLLAKALKSEDIATKYDIKSLEAMTKVEIEKIRGEIKALELTTKQEIKALETMTKIELEKIRGEIKALETSTTFAIKELELSTKISISESKTETIKWITGILVAQAGVIIAAIKLL